MTGKSHLIHDPALIQIATKQILDRSSTSPQIAIILGSGLSDVVERFELIASIPYKELAGMPAPSVSGHAGKVCVAKYKNVTVLFFCGRSHLYEGKSPKEVTYSVSLAKSTGASCLLITNAAGGLKPDFKPGDFMLITDHINLQATNVLVGISPPPFIDMSETYDKKWRKNLLEAVEQKQFRLHQGVYAGLLGPNYETPAEVRMLQILGADAVGMSTVQEALLARYYNMKILGLSLITNLASGISPSTLSHDEVKQIASNQIAQFSTLLQLAIETAPF